ncbi:MAG: hypothetical protein Q9171_001695 [Xanthocarpia ochracea]
MYSHRAIYAAISAMFLTSIVILALPAHTDASPSDTDLISTRSVDAPPSEALEKKSVSNALNDGRILTNLFAHVTALGNGWDAYWNVFDMIRPEVPTALEALIAFYQVLLSTARPQWAQNGQRGLGVSLGVTFVADTILKSGRWLQHNKFTTLEDW